MKKQFNLKRITALLTVFMTAVSIFTSASIMVSATDSYLYFEDYDGNGSVGDINTGWTHNSGGSLWHNKAGDHGAPNLTQFATPIGSNLNATFTVPTNGVILNGTVCLKIDMKMDQDNANLLFRDESNKEIFSFHRRGTNVFINAASAGENVKSFSPGFTRADWFNLYAVIDFKSKTVRFKISSGLKGTQANLINETIGFKDVNAASFADFNLTDEQINFDNISISEYINIIEVQIDKKDSVDTPIELFNKDTKELGFKLTGVSASVGGETFTPTAFSEVDWFVSNAEDGMLPAGVSINFLTGVLTIAENLPQGTYALNVVAKSYNGVFSDTITINIEKTMMSAEEILQQYINQFKIQTYIKDGSLVDITETAVSDNLDLSADAVFRGYKIIKEWISYNTNVISNDGVVSPEKTPTNVKLTAKFTISAPEEFEDYTAPDIISQLTVVANSNAMRPSRAFELDLDEFNAISLPESTTVNLTFPTTMFFGSQVTWSTSRINISARGEVTRDSEDRDINVQAMLSNGTYIKTEKRNWTVKVPRDSSIGIGGSSSVSSTRPNKSGSSIVILQHDITKTPEKPENPTQGDKDVELPTDDIFNDLDNVSWAVDAIVDLYEKGIIEGVSDNKFAPQQKITRAEAIKMIVKAFSITADTTDNKFSDVTADDWFYNAVGTAYNAGIISGIDENTYGPNIELSRQDFSVIIHNVLKKTGYSFREGENPEFSFRDDNQISDYADEAIYALYNEEIIDGAGDGSFEPIRSASRAEAAVLIHRVINRILQKN